MTLIKKEDKYSPRIRLWKKDKTSPGRDQARLEIADLPATRAIKAMVDTDECHDNFWKLINYLQSLAEIDLPAQTFRVMALENPAVAELLRRAPKEQALAVIREALGGNLSARQCVNEYLRVLTLRDAVPATLKTVVFGYLIGTVGCYRGITAEGGTEGVGRAATGGVVASIFLVLIADVILVKVIQILT